MKARPVWLPQPRPGPAGTPCPDVCAVGRIRGARTAASQALSRTGSQGARRQVPAIIDNVLRAGEGKTLRKLRTLVSQVNSIEEDYRALTDAELRAMTDELRQRHADGETLEDLLPEAFATVREAASRVIGQRHFDVQLMGGRALHMGNIAEMKKIGRASGRERV